MGTVDYLLRDPYNDPWPETQLEEKFVVAKIYSFHKASHCMNSRLKNNYLLNRNENIVEITRRNGVNNSSPQDYYGNLNGQKRTKLDRNEINQFSRLSKQQFSNKIKHFLSVLTQKTVHPQYCKNNTKLSGKQKNQLHLNKWPRVTTQTNQTSCGQTHHRNIGEVRTICRRRKRSQRRYREQTLQRTVSVSESNKIVKRKVYSIANLH